MRSHVAALALAHLAACGGKPSAPPVVVGPTATAPAPVCQGGAGTYRLRVGPPEQKHRSWLELVVAASPSRPGALAIASASAPYQFSDATFDAATCTLVASGEGWQPVTLTAKIDAATRKVVGTLTSPWRAGTSTAAEANGVVDYAPPDPPEPCFETGVYVLDSSASWTCDPPERTGMAMYRPFEYFTLRVAPWLDSVVITRAQTDPPHEALGGDEVVARKGCSVVLTMTHGRRMRAEIEFAGATLRGTASMELAAGDSGGGYRCWVTNAAFTGKRVR